jgi:hypothetical protein
MYKRETQSLSEKDKVMLNMWERKILRKVYAPATAQGGHRIRTNQELYKPSDLVADMIRMDPTRVAKKFRKSEGKRNVGWPKLRWAENVE